MMKGNVRLSPRPECSRRRLADIAKSATVARLPDDHRRPDGQRDQRRQPEPGAAKDARPAGHQQAHGEADQQEEDRLFVEEADAHDESEDRPQPLTPRAQDADDEQRGDRPGQQVVDRGAGEAAGGEERAQGDEERGEALGEAVSAELAGDESGDEHRDCHGQRGEEAQADQRVAEQDPRERHEGDGTDRLVDVAPGHVSRGLQEVEFVPVIAVARSDGEQQGQSAEAMPSSGHRATGGSSVVRSEPAASGSPTGALLSIESSGCAGVRVESLCRRVYRADRSFRLSAH